MTQNTVLEPLAMMNLVFAYHLLKLLIFYTDEILFIYPLNFESFFMKCIFHLCVNACFSKNTFPFLTKLTLQSSC